MHYLLAVISVLLVYAQAFLSAPFFLAFFALCAFAVFGYAGIALTTPKE